MKRVLVTGPDGFVGSQVYSELVKRDYSVRGAQWKAGQIPTGCESVTVGDINENTNWQSVLKDVEIVVHLAARVHVMNDWSDDPLSAFREVNVEGTRRLAECAAAAGVQHFLFISSIKVNGESTNGKPFAEEDVPKPEERQTLRPHKICHYAKRQS